MEQLGGKKESYLRTEDQKHQAQQLRRIAARSARGSTLRLLTARFHRRNHGFF